MCFQSTIKNKKNFLKLSFTFVEILVVATIIALLATSGIITYSSLTKSSRDAKRKADLEQIRAALEMYRSNNGSYPTITINCSSSGGISDSNNVYLYKIPKDPKCPTYSYSYSVSFSSFDYTLGAYLESGGPGCPTTYSCGSQNCNFCLGPYGQK